MPDGEAMAFLICFLEMGASIGTAHRTRRDKETRGIEADGIRAGKNQERKAV